MFILLQASLVQTAKIRIKPLTLKVLGVFLFDEGRNQGRNASNFNIILIFPKITTNQEGIIKKMNLIEFRLLK